MLQAGFSEVDVTPPVGTEKIGWLKQLVSEQVLDPLFARVAVFETENERVAFIQLDTLSIRWTHVADIRRRIQQACGFPGAHIMVAATHNHAGPAVTCLGDARRDETCIEALTVKLVQAFQDAWQCRQPAEIGFGSGYEWSISRNRRVVMRDGTVRTHGTFDDKQSLYIEGPVDPEVAVIAVRDMQGGLMGCLVNFACHPTHKGDSTFFSAGYPGYLAGAMKHNACPVTLFLNGACGNVHDADPRTGKGTPMREIGARLAADVMAILQGMKFQQSVRLGCRSATIELPFRTLSDAEISGTVRGAQRFVDPAIYDRGMPGLLAKLKKAGTQKAEVQAIRVGDCALAAIPAEYFVEHGLRIKQESHPVHVLVVGQANGMVGYVPTREAFRRGGYETTFAGSSRLAPEAGDMLADTAIGLVKQL